MKNQMLFELNDFLNKDKFAKEEWNKRGLNPSDKEICDYLSSVLNVCTKSLIILASKNSSKKDLKIELIQSLKSIKKSSLDTEEKEFLGDYFFKLGQITEVDIKEDLSKWLYGNFTYSFLKLIKGLHKN